ncbi:MAG TPA: 16S rRNA (guanine(527)-N(7))-methyltransferase RsmG [Pyrinomonadaceae bacterium]|nr:16S rRNA (guanine(527)-N(7))-methyltransferase RsmG [Pyrinomonadaceae bacterium]
MDIDFFTEIKKRQAAFGVDLSDETIAQLSGYFDLVQEHNLLLHLVAPCSPAEFATRHILESLTLLEYLPHNSRFVDVGTGAGLPSIPCLIARPDLSAVLIESKEKKVKYLESTIEKLGLSDRAEIVNKRFEEVEAEGFSIVTCRALDKFTQRFARLVKWSGKRRMLLFGGKSLRVEIERSGRKYEEKLMPLSEQRYLFLIS